MIARPSLVVAFIFALMMLAASSCSAATSLITPSGSVGAQYSTNAVKFVDGAGDFARLVSREIRPSTSAGGLSDFSRLMAMESHAARVGGREIAVTATRAIGAGSVATAAVALGASAYAGWQVGSAIADAMGLTPTSSGPVRCVPGEQWQCDEGAVPSIEQGFRINCAVGWGACEFFGSSRAVICDQAGKRLDALSPSWVLDGTSVSNNFTCYVNLKTANGNGSTYSYSFGMPAAESSYCPASIDALNPAWSVDKGAAPDPDGKCKSGRYNSTEPSKVAERLAEHGVKSAFPRLAEEVLNKGGTIEAEGPRSLSGPSSVPGEPSITTTTLPDGSTRTETRTPKTNYTYNGDTITYNTSYTTVINNGGDITTIEEGGPGAAQEGETDCEKFPDAIGCSKYGDPPGDQPPWEDKDIPFEPVDLGVSGSCPPPTTWTLPRSGYTMTWSYAPACEIAPVVRAGLLIITAMGCMVFIVGTVRS